MSQIETTKVVQYVLVGPNDDEIAVPKLVMYVWAVPGESEDNEGQGHVHTQIMRRD
jgi:hypothetical protein